MNFKKLTTLALSIFLVTSTIPTTNVFADEAPSLFETQEVTKQDNSQLFKDRKESLERLQGILVYSINEDNTVTISEYSGYDIEIIVPSEIGGKVVTSIGDSAFAWCNSLVRMELPDTINFIGKEAFLNCDSLLNIKLPDSLTSISASTFSGCTRSCLRIKKSTKS